MVDIKPNTSELLPLDDYDLIVVSFSGGKDSLACLLHLMELGAPRDRLEVWHQAVDGEPGKAPRFFDWPCTESYCVAVAQALEVPIRFQWRENGFEGEITKGDPEPRATAPIAFELEPGGIATGRVGTAGGTGKPGVRLKFPAVSADLQVRWCSSMLKIDVAASAITNDPRVKKGGNVLMVTGERRQESMNRSKYASVVQHKSTTKKRRVDQWRAILDWEEGRVWEIIEKWRVRPHPAYYLGWGRVSCFPCIFGSPNQWASVRALDPEQFQRILDYERSFGYTIQKGGDIEHQANRGQSFIPADDENALRAMSEDYPVELAIVPEDEEWELPLGGMGQISGSSGGPL